MPDLISNSAKMSMVIKLARTALGLSQQEFASKMSVSKTTLARIETMEAKVSFDFYMQVTKIINELGVTFDLESSDEIVLRVSAKTQQAVIDIFADENNRRTDRKKKEIPK